MNRYQREYPGAVRPATAWRRANFREASWRRLTGITAADTCTAADPAFTCDTVADRKRAKMGLTPGERPHPPNPTLYPPMPLSYRLWRRKVARKMERETIRLLDAALHRLTGLGAREEAKRVEDERFVKYVQFFARWGEWA